MMTSTLGVTTKIDGKKVSSKIIEKNGLLNRLKSIWPENANVLFLASDPDNYKNNDKRFGLLKESLSMSGLSVKMIEFCDHRNSKLVNDMSVFQVIILIGGHVPTQNHFFNKIRLKEKLTDYEGIVVAWSAGSMNCAEIVYAGPELEGEAIDPTYERWLSGLGLTNINIFPHFQSLRDNILDGMRLVEDITFEDSIGHEFIALNDGSFIMIEDGTTTLYGEAYMIKDAKMWQICKENEKLIFEWIKTAGVNMDRITRIKLMEEKLDKALEATKAMDEAYENFMAVIPEIKELIAYYESDLWREDFDADTKGELPEDLKRGVLSEDGIYNLLTDYQRLKEIVDLK